MGSDFVVESKGHCFFCLNKTYFGIHERSQSYLSSSPICSLQSLSRYLKLDMRKVFSEKEAIPQFLLDQVQNSKLKVGLCEKCATLNNTFNKLYRQLEKIEMEVASSLKHIHRTMTSSEEGADRLKNLACQMDSTSDGWKEKINILDVIRKEAIQKCSYHLYSYRYHQPRVKVQNMTKMEILEKQNKLISTSSSSSLEIHDNLSNCFSDAILDPVLNKESIKAEQCQASCDDKNYTPEDDDWGMQSRHSSAMDLDDDELMTRSKEDQINPRQPSREELTSSTANLIYEELAPSGLSLEGMPIACLNPQTGKHKCPSCSTEFGTVNNFKRHYKNIHLNVKYRCQCCEKIFGQIFTCHTHYRNVHRGIRFKCRGCAKLFTTKSDLTRHLRKGSCGMQI